MIRSKDTIDKYKLLENYFTKKNYNMINMTNNNNNILLDDIYKYNDDLSESYKDSEEEKRIINYEKEINQNKDIITRVCEFENNNILNRYHYINDDDSVKEINDEDIESQFNSFNSYEYESYNDILTKKNIKSLNDNIEVDKIEDDEISENNESRDIFMILF